MNLRRSMTVAFLLGLGVLLLLIVLDILNKLADRSATLRLNADGTGNGDGSYVVDALDPRLVRD